MLSRVFLAGFFLATSYFNTRTAIQTPDIYLTYANLTPISLYKDFINHYFAQHIRAFILIIAAGQALIFLGLLLNRSWTKLACLGGIIFGVAIAPLMIGSAFPATILMAVAYLILFRNYEHDYIWKWDQYLLKQSAFKTQTKKRSPSTSPMNQFPV